MLVLHLGENDILMMSAMELTDLTVQDLHCLLYILPASDWLRWICPPWRVWHGTVKLKVVDTTRREINRMLHKAMQVNGGQC